MAQSLSERGKARSQRLARSLTKSADYLNRLSIPELLETLINRDRVGVNSYPASGSSASIVAFTRGGKSDTTPVERAAIASMDGKGRRDPLREELRKIEKKIFDAEDLLRQALESATFFIEGVEKQRGRQQSPPCESCSVLPQTRSGFCSGCFDEWADNGYPDRQRWVMYKTAMRNSEGILLVSDPPLGKSR